MKIGVDFDNTIISYDAVFHEATREWGFDVSVVASNKTAVRDFLRGLGKEETWIELQGYVYGKKMIEAEPFPGVLKFFATAKARGIELRIISHKTRHPFRGPQYDLHEASRHWLDKLGLSDGEHHGIGSANVFLELTKEEKAARIAAEACDVFIDDLPEFLTLPSFPQTTEGLLFAPAGPTEGNWRGRIFSSWSDLHRALLEPS